MVSSLVCSLSCAGLILPVVADVPFPDSYAKLILLTFILGFYLTAGGQSACS